MRTLIVHNPRSGFGSDAIFEFERALLKEGDECVMRLLTSNPQEDKARLEDAESFDIVVISGGDGTVASALYYLRGREVSTCIFPSGTANLLAANIGNANEPAALAAACRNGSVAHTDLGQISWQDDQGNDRTSGFGLMCGVGFDAKIMHDAKPGKQVLGEAAYFAAAIANPLPTVINFKIETDGEVHNHVGICCLVANNAMLQGDIEIVPDCNMADGLLDVIVVESTATPQLIAPLMAGIFDPAGHDVARPLITRYKTSKVRITCDKPTKMEIDGDVVEGEVTYLEAQTIAGCSRMIVDRFSRYAPC